MVDPAKIWRRGNELREGLVAEKREQESGSFVSNKPGLGEIS